MAGHGVVGSSMYAVEEVHPQVYRLRLPLPFALRHVHVYLFQGDEGWQVLDTGLHTPEGEAVWERVIGDLALESSGVTDIWITHAHPDHLGMAGWLQKRFGGRVPVHMSEASLAYAEYVWVRPDVWQEAMQEYLKRVGATPEIHHRLLEDMAVMRRRVQPFPREVQTHRPGAQAILGDRRYRLLSAPGHSDDQVIFYDEAGHVLFVGDQVLERITPNVGQWPGTAPGVLQRYLDSLRQLRSLAVQRAFPGHYGVITRFHVRIDELLEHHRQRLQEMYRAVAGGAGTVLEVAREVFPFERFSSHEVRFALAETLAHLEHLVAQGRLIRTEWQGVWIYSVSPGPRSTGGPGP